MLLGGGQAIACATVLVGTKWLTMRYEPVACIAFVVLCSWRIAKLEFLSLYRKRAFLEDRRRQPLHLAAVACLGCPLFGLMYRATFTVMAQPIEVRTRVPGRVHVYSQVLEYWHILDA